jgi:hypothetical protein
VAGVGSEGLMAKIWFFKPGTEQRVEVLYMSDKNKGEERWIIPCQQCGKNFTLRPEHGVSVGADGALSTAHSMNCPACMSWHVIISRGVVTVL